MQKQKINYKSFTIEAIKITLFTLILLALFKLFKSSDKELIVYMTMIIFSAASAFPIRSKLPKELFIITSSIVIFVIIGGLINHFLPQISGPITLVLAGLTFFIPKSKERLTLFIMCTIAFLIFSNIPTTLENSINYLYHGIIIIIAFPLTYHFINKKHPKLKFLNSIRNFSERKITLYISVCALLLSYFATSFLKEMITLNHLYWSSLTALLVIQGSYKKTIQTALLRTFSNTLGAIVIVVLYSYIIPDNFYINIALLTIFLFLIFALGFSYFGRTFFIELYVLSCTHIIGTYKGEIAFDRVVLTLVGSFAVILTSLMFFLLKRKY